MDAVTLLSNMYHSSLKKNLDLMRDNPMIPLLKYRTLPDEQNSEEIDGSATSAASMEQLFEKSKKEGSPEVTARLLHAIFSAEVDSTFHKINVHAAMTPADVEKHFEPIFRQANFFLQSKRKKPEETLIVTVRTNYPAYSMVIEILLHI